MIAPPARRALGRLLAVVLLLAVGACRPGSPQPEVASVPPGRPLPPEDAALLRQILRERITAGDIPEFRSVRAQGTTILVRSLGDIDLSSALPHIPGLTLAIVSYAEAEARARRTGRPIFFLIVSRPLVTGDTAAVTLGGDVAFPPGDGLKLCCCERVARYLRREGVWRFVGWGEGMCA